jgi:hypothetical protein
MKGELMTGDKLEQCREAAAELHRAVDELNAALSKARALALRIEFSEKDNYLTRHAFGKGLVAVIKTEIDWRQPKAETPAREATP